MRLLLVLALAVSAGAQCGDCNMDGQVSILDALVAAQGAAGFTPIFADGTPMPLERCDVAAPQAVRSGSVASPPVMTILDALRIAQWSLGIGAPLVCV